MRYLWLVLFCNAYAGPTRDIDLTSLVTQEVNYSILRIFGPSFFKNYPNYYFVETGTAGGDSIIQALKAGFKEIHSIEIVPSVAKRAQQKFAKNKNVHVWLGDSSIILAKIIARCDKPITFWLDAHCQAALQTDHMNTAILNELETIKQHPIKTHTILIDDMRIFGTAEHNYIAIEQLIKKIKEINPAYVITFIEGTTKNDVLVAQVPPT